MALPEQLVRSYEAISRLSSHVVDDEFAATFADILNDAVPAITDSKAFALYMFNRRKYLADKHRFVADIFKFKPYEAMILWADSEEILEHFKLKDRFNLQWNDKLTAYVGSFSELVPSMKRHGPVESSDTGIERIGEPDDPMNNVYKRMAMASLQANVR